MNKIMTLIAITIFILIGCGGNPDANPSQITDSSQDIDSSQNTNTENDIDLNNVISMSYQNVLKKTSSAVTCIEDSTINNITDSNFINLGCFFKSGNYYFILNNNSNYDVTNLKITSSNQAFEVTPDSLSVLGIPGKTAGVTPIIRISVNHRSALNSEANTDALPRGVNTTTITISGIVNGESFVNTFIIGGTAKTIEARYDDSTNTCYVDGPMIIDGIYNENYSVHYMGSTGNIPSWNCLLNWKILINGNVTLPSVFGQTIANGNDITKDNFSIVLSI